MLPMAAVSWSVWVQEMLPAGSWHYTEGSLNLAGLLSWLLLLPLWATSLPAVRRQCHETFIWLHMLWLPVSSACPGRHSPVQGWCVVSCRVLPQQAECCRHLPRVCLLSRPPGRRHHQHHRWCGTAAVTGMTPGLMSCPCRPTAQAMLLAAMHDQCVAFFLCTGWLLRAAEGPLRRRHCSATVSATTEVLADTPHIELLRLRLHLPRYMMPERPGAQLEPQSEAW
jgi:hypothetical protein